MMQHLDSKASAAAAIRRTLDVLFEPGQVVELRVPKIDGKKRTDSGYFDDFDKLAQAAARLDGRADGVYVTLNPVEPALLARAENHMREWADLTTSDDNIVRRQWLPIDCDPKVNGKKRPAGISSTDEEHTAALDKAQEIRAWLSLQGWPDPTEADSGNGGALLYPIDLPNDTASAELVQQVLLALARKFDDDRVDIDTSVFNAARIWKLYGTLAGKGDSTAQRPHRRARVLATPAERRPVPADLVRAVARTGQEQQQNTRPRSGSFDVGAWLDRHDIHYTKGTHGDKTKYVLDECVFNPDHKKPDAAVIVRANGIIGYECFHNSCQQYTWSDVRQKLDPPYSGNGSYDEPPHPADVTATPATAAPSPDDDEPDEPIELAPASSFPALPAEAQLPEDLGKDACPWLDEYIAFSRIWAPDAYDGMHEAIGLWVLATVAARRVYLPWGAGVYTNLYLANCARSSLFTKTTAAGIGIDLIYNAGLAPLLMPDETTPESFVRGLTQKVPEGFVEMSDDQREFYRRRLAFAGQRSWAYDEFGMKLSAMMRENGTMAAFRGLLRIFDDTKPSYERETIGRGVDHVRQPYLSLLASLTPADIRPHAKRGSALWGDGFFARFSFVTPPPGAEDTNNRLPEGERIIPDALLRPLRKWHERLGVPDASINERLDEKGKGTGFYDVKISALPEHRYGLDSAVLEAFYTYRGALKKITRNLENDDLDPSYSRLPVKAMRVALLFASLEGSAQIELHHWARAQAITERWRANLHNLIDQLQVTGEATRESTLEARVLSTLDRIRRATLRDFRRYLPGTSTEELERLLTVLARNGVVVVSRTRKGTKRYDLPAHEPSNRRTVENARILDGSEAQGHRSRTVGRN